MIVSIDTNERDIILYDKVNITHVTNKEVVLLNSISGNFKDKLFHIITSTNNLSDNACEIYSTILGDYPYHININIKDLIAHCIQKYNKSAITYKRAIDALCYKGVIRRDTRGNTINLKEAYNINLITECAKYIVIKI